MFSCGMPMFSYGIWDLIPQPGIEPRPPALGAWSLSRWTTREVPRKDLDRLENRKMSFGSYRASGW